MDSLRAVGWIHNSEARLGGAESALANTFPAINVSWGYAGVYRGYLGTMERKW